MRPDVVYHVPIPLHAVEDLSLNLICHDATAHIPTPKATAIATRAPVLKSDGKPPDGLEESIVALASSGIEAESVPKEDKTEFSGMLSQPATVDAYAEGLLESAAGAYPE